MEKIKLTLEIEVQFHGYKTKRLNQKARTGIRKWIRDAAQHHLCFIPMYVEKGEDGSLIEDCSSRTKIKILEV